MTRCWIREPENRVNFTEIVKRFDGDYDFTIQRPQKAPQKGPQPNYSVPPNAKASKQGKIISGYAWAHFQLLSASFILLLLRCQCQSVFRHNLYQDRRKYTRN